MSVGVDHLETQLARAIGLTPELGCRSGEAKNWPLIVAGVTEVRDAARRFLDSAQEADLDRVIPYDGSISYLRPVGLSLCYAVMRIAAHHFVHVGEVVTIRSRLGHAIGDFPEWGQALV